MFSMLNQTFPTILKWESRVKELFSSDLRVDRLLRLLSFETGVTINAHETLLIVDEIQECPRALTSLKYFCKTFALF